MKSDRKKKIYNFNGYNRDVWVAEKAKTVTAGSDVLDAGAGTGIYRHLFSHCKYKSQDFCQVPSSEGKYIEMNYVCDIAEIPVSDNSFDVILCTEVLEHVTEPIKVIKEFSRIIRPGGRIFITAPLGCGIHQEPYIFYGGFTPFWYEHFLSASGFESIQIIPNCGFFRFYGQESRRFFRYLFPRDMSIAAKILTCPLRLILALIFHKIIPLSCYYLDSRDTEKRITVGYFVEAVKKDKTDSPPKLV